MRTLIGQLVLTLQQNFTAEGAKVKSAVDGIETSINRLNGAAWGSAFQKQLDRLKLSPTEIAAVQQSWDTLFNGLSSKDLKTALDKDMFANWRTATVGHFAAVRSEAVATETSIKSLAGTVRTVLQPALVAMGAYTMAYGGGMVLRGGIASASQRDREQWLELMSCTMTTQQMATLKAQAGDLSAKYPSVDQTAIMALGRQAGVAMGSATQGMKLLEDLVKMQVVLQSTAGTERADNVLGNVVRSADILGLNKPGDLGIEQVRGLLDGLTKAAQVEGTLFDPGSMLTFARRAKIAGPAFDPEFLSTVAPAIVQDVGAPQAGTAMASAFKSFIIGDMSKSDSRYMLAQRDLGLRDDKGIVDENLFGANPYTWVKKYLIPALAKAGTDMSDDTAIAAAVGKISSNTNASALLTRMVTQQSQLDKWIAQYRAAPGLSSAQAAVSNDPFVAFEGLKSGLANLAAAIADKVNIIVPGLNAITGAINGLSKWIEANPTWAVAGAGAGLAAAGWGAFKMGSGILGLSAAGPALQVAAADLMAAATALEAAAGAQAAESGVVGTARTAGSAAFGWAVRGGAAQEAGMTIGEATSALGWGALRVLGPAGAVAAVMQPVPAGAGEGDYLRTNPDYRKYIDEHRVYANASGGPDDRVGGLKNSADSAKAALDALNNTKVAPVVDGTTIARTLRDATELEAVLTRIGKWAGVAATGAINSQINRSLSDHGVAP